MAQIKNRGAIVNARINAKTKRDAVKVLESLGVSTSDSINIFFKMLILHQGFPFDLRIPNKTTLATMAETNSVVEFESAEKLFEDLDI